MVNKDVLCTIAVTPPSVHRRNVNKQLFEMLKQEKQPRKCRHLRLNPPLTLIHSRPPHYKKEHDYQQDSFTKKINSYGAWKRRTRNTQTIRPVNCWGLNRAPGGRILKDTNIRRRITYLVESIPDPFAANILYHKSCWTGHVLLNLNNRLEDSHLQNINIDDAR